MKILKTVLVLILTITLPISQAHAVIPDPHGVLSDTVESNEEHQEVNISALEGDAEPAQIPTGDLFQVETIISGNTAEEPSIEMPGEQDLLEVPVLAEDDQKFWTTKKIVISTSLLLTTGLLIGLLLLLAGSGSGGSGGSGVGVGAGGGIGGILPVIPTGPGGPTGPANLTNPFVPTGGIPHNPEPSTFLLMGLGLLVPFLRKRLSL